VPARPFRFDGRGHRPAQFALKRRTHHLAVTGAVNLVHQEAALLFLRTAGRAARQMRFHPWTSLGGETAQDE
jgi:hypothetical protein